MARRAVAVSVALAPTTETLRNSGVTLPAQSDSKRRPVNAEDAVDPGREDLCESDSRLLGVRYFVLSRTLAPLCRLAGRELPARGATTSAGEQEKPECAQPPGAGTRAARGAAVAGFFPTAALAAAATDVRTPNAGHAARAAWN